MRLTVVGCSGSIPGPDSPASCYLLEEQGFRLVLDLGSGALGPLQRHAPLTGIDAICLSHLHADHCLDLCPLWVAQVYAPDGPRPRIPVSGPDGTPERLDRAYGVTEEPGMAGAFDFGTLQPGTRQIGPFEITLARMNHPVETYGFRIAAGGRVIAYSADTGPSDALVSLARDAELLLCEASFLDGPGLPGNLHMTAKQAAQHATRAGVGHLMLTHLAPWNDRERSRAEAAAGFGGQLTLATTGLVADLG
ncbi:MAG TPA: MBL fold metallo-hydrolase [Streptosporangiaceae bacterium]